MEEQLAFDVAGDSSPPSEFLTIAEATQRVRCCERTIRRAIDSGALRAGPDPRGRRQARRLPNPACRPRDLDVRRWPVGGARRPLRRASTAALTARSPRCGRCGSLTPPARAGGSVAQPARRPPSSARDSSSRNRAARCSHRRTSPRSSTPRIERVRLSEHFSGVKAEIATCQVLLAADGDERLSAAYNDLVETARATAGAESHEAWKAAAVATDSEMNMGALHGRLRPFRDQLREFELELASATLPRRKRLWRWWCRTDIKARRRTVIELPHDRPGAE